MVFTGTVEPQRKLALEATKLEVSMRGRTATKSQPNKQEEEKQNIRETISFHNRFTVTFIILLIHSIRKRNVEENKLLLRVSKKPTATCFNFLPLSQRLESLSQTKKQRKEDQTSVG